LGKKKEEKEQPDAPLNENDDQSMIYAEEKKKSKSCRGEKKGDAQEIRYSQR